MSPSHKLETPSIPLVTNENITPEIITDKYVLNIKSESARLRYSIGEYVDGTLELLDTNTGRLVQNCLYMLPISTGEIVNGSIDWSIYKILLDLTGYFTVFKARWNNTRGANVTFRRATAGLTPFIDKTSDEYKNRVEQFKHQLSELFYNNCCRIRYTNPKFSTNALIDYASKLTLEDNDVKCFQVAIGIPDKDFKKLFDNAKKIAINRYNNTSF